MIMLSHGWKCYPTKLIGVIVHGHVINVFIGHVINVFIITIKYNTKYENIKHIIQIFLQPYAK